MPEHDRDHTLGAHSPTSLTKRCLDTCGVVARRSMIAAVTPCHLDNRFVSLLLAPIGVGGDSKVRMRSDESTLEPDVQKVRGIGVLNHRVVWWVNYDSVYRVIGEWHSHRIAALDNRRAPLRARDLGIKCTNDSTRQRAPCRRAVTTSCFKIVEPERYDSVIFEDYGHILLRWTHPCAARTVLEKSSDISSSVTTECRDVIGRTASLFQSASQIVDDTAQSNESKSLPGVAKVPECPIPVLFE